MSNNRVRFAPSPTGELHIGGARTALFNYLHAKAVGAAFVLRIDDTDLERSREEYTDKLIDAMHWLGLEWDEGPLHQSKRIDIYKKQAERLLVEKKAYYCYCSHDELTRGREEARKDNRSYLYPGSCRNLLPEQQESLSAEGRRPVIRLLTPDEGVTVVKDIVRGDVSFENSDLDDFIILKSNGMPTYNFASIVDDCQMEITDIIRAEEHLSNTPRQQLCAIALGYNLPRFAHLSMILAPDRSKLSKRHGATSVEEFRSEGYLPEALLNYLSLLGWSPGDDLELLAVEEMVKRFKLDKVTKTAAIYDVNKLAWMNGHYMREYDTVKLARLALPFYQQQNLLADNIENNDLEFLVKVINLVKERARTLVELAEASYYFYRDDFNYDEKGVKKNFKKEGNTEILKRLAEELRSLDTFNKETTEALFNELSENMEISPGRLIGPARLALTGRTGGPGIFETLELLGREKSVARIEKALEYINGI